MLKSAVKMQIYRLAHPNGIFMQCKGGIFYTLLIICDRALGGDLLTHHRCLAADPVTLVVELVVGILHLHAVVHLLSGQHTFVVVDVRGLDILAHHVHGLTGDSAVLPAVLDVERLTHDRQLGRLDITVGIIDGIDCHLALTVLGELDVDGVAHHVHADRLDVTLGIISLNVVELRLCLHSEWYGQQGNHHHNFLHFSFQFSWVYNKVDNIACKDITILFIFQIIL